MARLIYSAIASLDGYVEDEQGKFDWAEPDEEVHAFVNDLERPVGTYLYGRRMYETMAVWETARAIAARPGSSATSPRSGRPPRRSSSPGRWRRSRAPRTRIERDFDPEAIRADEGASAERDLAVGGADLAAQAIAGGLVDEVPPSLRRAGRSSAAASGRCPTVAGSGSSCSTSVASSSGFVHLAYRAAPTG